MRDAHIVKSFDKDLNKLTKIIASAGELAGSQLRSAGRLLEVQESWLPAKVLESNSLLKSQVHEVDHLTVNLLALRQPMAIDLRSIVAALKIAADLERVGDYSVSIARHMAGVDPIAAGAVMHPLQEMAGLSLQMLNDTMQAYNLLNVEKAIEVWHRDRQLDTIYTNLLTEFPTYMQFEPQSTSVFTSLLFIARCLERIGDHIKNIDEHIYFVVYGETYQKSAASC